MAIGKSKKKGPKGGKKKIIDPFARKEWYTIRAPAVFKERNVGLTPVNRSAATFNAIDALKGRVFEVSLADLQKNEEFAHRKMKLKCLDVREKYVLTNFWGMSLTTDKLKSLVRKFQTLIEANCEVTTSDGYTMRMFMLAFTKRRPNQIRKTSYASSVQIRRIRNVMIETMQKEAAESTLREMVAKFIPESLGKKVAAQCHSIYPLQNVFVRKVKMIRTPKYRPADLLDAHESKVGEDTGKPVEAEQQPQEQQQTA